MSNSPQVVTLRGGTATKRAERPAVGLLRQVSDVHLALGAEQTPKGSTQSMGAAASTLLLAVCIRCGREEVDLQSSVWVMQRACVEAISGVRY